MGMMVALNHEMIPACNTHAHTPQWHAYNKYTINEACTKCTRLHRELQTATEAVSPCLGLFSAVYSVTMTHTHSRQIKCPRELAHVKRILI